MTVQVRFTTRAPDEKLHGLEDIREQLVEHDQETVVVVAKVRTYKVDHMSEKGGLDVPVVRILAVEPLTGERAKAALKLYDEAYAERTGDQHLPREFWAEDEKTGQMRKVDPGKPRDEWLDPQARGLQDEPAERESDGSGGPLPEMDESAYPADAEPIPVPGDAADQLVDAILEPDYILRYNDKAGWIIGPKGALPIDTAGPDIAPEQVDAAQQWAAEAIRDTEKRDVIRWRPSGDADGWYVALLVDPDDDPPAHPGADEGWANQVRQMRMDLAAEDGKLLCTHCGTPLTPQEGTGNYLDSEGMPARDGHAHEPEPMGAST